MPDDCDKTDATFEQLKSSTEHCFRDENYPINSVAHRIIQDVRHLRRQLEREILLRQDQRDDDVNFSFNFAAAKAAITTDDKWCTY